MQYALTDATGNLIRLEYFAASPPDLAAQKGLRWLPVEDVRPPAADGRVLAGPAVTVHADHVARVWTTQDAPPPPVPAVVGKAQAIVILRRSGLLAAVDAAVAAAGEEAVLAWGAAHELSRDGVIVGHVAAAVGLSAPQLDDLFRAAAGLRL